MTSIKELLDALATGRPLTKEERQVNADILIKYANILYVLNGLRQTNTKNNTLEQLKQITKHEKRITPHICVPTPAGKLKAYASECSQYPGIFIVLQPRGTSDEVDLLFAEVKQDKTDKDDDTIHLYVYDDAHTDDYGHKYEIDVKDILQSLND